jgi:N-acetylglucosaminyldiphosphoundecaprenol N-acetyl-beta-D-mannosaminyltransferase
MHAPELMVPVMIGVGGTLDFIAGVTRRAPDWMQRSGLEWVYRLAQEPRRLWRRYMVDLVGFGYFFLRQWAAMYPRRLMRRSTPARPPMIMPAAESEPVLIDGVAVLSAGERLTLASREAFLAQADEALGNSAQIVVDLARTSFVDSSGYGSLVTLAKRARGVGGEVRLAGLQPQVRQVLRVLRLEQLFSIYPDTAAALVAAKQPGLASGEPPAAWSAPLADSVSEPATAPALLQPEVGRTPLSGTDLRLVGWQTVRAPRRLDALSAPEFRARCAALLATSPRLIVDLSETLFLASAGLAALIALSREARSLNGELRLACLMPDALRVVKLAKLDGVFAIYNDVTEAGR